LIDCDGISKLDIVNLPRVPLDPILIEAHAPYMVGFWPPEELKQSKNIDARSDMFSFAASLYYAVTGQSPFGKGSRTELIARTLTERPPDPRTLSPELSDGFCKFVMKCLQPDAKDRFDSTQEFLDAVATVKLTAHTRPTPRKSSFGPLEMGESSVIITPDAKPLAVGDTLGQCKLEKTVGAGAFGVVYKGRHQLLDIPVAVKVLPLEIASR